MRSEVGDQALETLTEKGPKRQKGPQSVCKNRNLPKKHHDVSQKGPFVKILCPPRSLRRDKISGTRGDRSPQSPQFLQPWLPPLKTWSGPRYQKLRSWVLDTLTRALLGEAFECPLRFIEDSENMAARSTAGFSPTWPPIFSAAWVKILTQGHARSGHQVRSSEPTTK